VRRKKPRFPIRRLCRTCGLEQALKGDKKIKDKCACGVISSHTIYEKDIKKRLCCKCYVQAGNPPADWHDGCMHEAKASAAIEWGKVKDGETKNRS